LHTIYAIPLKKHNPLIANNSIYQQKTNCINFGIFFESIKARIHDLHWYGKHPQDTIGLIYFIVTQK